LELKSNKLIRVWEGPGDGLSDLEKGNTSCLYLKSSTYSRVFQLVS